MTSIIDTACVLSLVVPAVQQEHLPALIASLDGFSDPRVEIIVINQSGSPLKPEIIQGARCPVIEHRTAKIIPAAMARNLGAAQAKGEYLFFLDDDAVFSTGSSSILSLLSVLATRPAAVVVQRGETKDGAFHSHWPKGESSVTFRNFPRLVIEWNLIIQKQVFTDLGAFPEIGTGSDHSALSGEAFVLVARLLSLGKNICLLPDVWVAHPSLLEKPKSLKQALGYAYGAGYAVGLGFNTSPWPQQAYWLLRGIGAGLRDRYSPMAGVSRVLEAVSEARYKRAISRCRLIGLRDGFLRQAPRSQEWLLKQQNLVL